MRTSLAILAACASLSVATVARAGCDDIVVDDAHVISDIGKVTAAAQKLGNIGADVRVRTIRALKGAPNLDNYELTMEQQCPSWQSGGHRKSTLLVIMIHPAKYVMNNDVKTDIPLALDAGVYYGVQHKEKLEPKWISIRNSSLTPAINAYANGEKDAYTKGFVSMIDTFGSVLKTPAGGSGNTTIVNNQASDSSWFGTMVVSVAIIGALAFVGIVFFRNRQDGGDIKAAQQKARGVFADCVTRIQTISNPKFVSERKFAISAAEGILPAGTIADLNRDLEKLGSIASSARSALSRFLPDQEKDPNTNGLSASAYASNEQACADMIVSFVEPAEELAKKIDGATDSAHAEVRVA